MITHRTRRYNWRLANVLRSTGISGVSRPFQRSLLAWPIGSCLGYLIGLSLGTIILILTLGFFLLLLA
jgi:hypothetical protein